MYSFSNDYSECAHPNIIGALANEGLNQNNGYGIDSHCEEATQLIKDHMPSSNVDIHYLPGGTIANLTFISHVLKPYEAVISAHTGHINVHEAGSIEACGHKILTAQSPDGKLSPEMILPIIDQHEDEHFVLPAMVYISNPTEVGTIYTKNELTALHDFCQQHGLLLFVDGARLAMALTANTNDLTLEDLSQLTDAFYIGGTKVGALFGEALVIVNDSLKKNFRYNMKQRGAIMAKGWLLGIQFKELFKEDLYFELGDHANYMASLLRNEFKKSGYTFLAASPTNQLFPIFPNWLVDKLNEKYITQVISKPDDQSVCLRFVTSWATKEEDILTFINDFREMQHTK